MLLIPCSKHESIWLPIKDNIFPLCFPLDHWSCAGLAADEVSTWRVGKCNGNLWPIPGYVYMYIGYYYSTLICTEYVTSYLMIYTHSDSCALVSRYHTFTTQCLHMRTYWYIFSSNNSTLYFCSWNDLLLNLLVTLVYCSPLFRKYSTGMYTSAITITQKCNINIETSELHLYSLQHRQLIVLFPNIQLWL